MAHERSRQLPQAPTRAAIPIAATGPRYITARRIGKLLAASVIRGVNSTASSSPAIASATRASAPQTAERGGRPECTMLNERTATVTASAVTVASLNSLGTWVKTRLTASLPGWYRHPQAKPLAAFPDPGFDAQLVNLATATSGDQCKGKRR